LAKTCVHQIPLPGLGRLLHLPGASGAGECGSVSDCLSADANQAGKWQADGSNDQQSIDRDRDVVRVHGGDPIDWRHEVNAGPIEQNIVPMREFPMLSISGRTWALMERHLDVEGFRSRFAGVDEDLDLELRMAHRAADAWRARSAVGTVKRNDAEQQRTLKEQLTTREAAEMLMVTPRAIRKWIDSGRLKAAMVDGRWLIERETLVALKQMRRP